MYENRGKSKETKEDSLGQKRGTYMKQILSLFVKQI